MWRKTGLYLIIAIFAFIIGTAFNMDLFAEKKDDDKKYEMILKKLYKLEKNQEEQIKMLKRINTKIQF
ncbi:MAG: hypothetical protein KAI43_00865 [Candidatus Aureabacteria bacterium]|nr:hypothetical protein [Candidatus Auribacterota bacterium]